MNLRCYRHPQRCNGSLRNINLLLQMQPVILSNKIRIFFCKFNDLLYVKVEKLKLMVRLASKNGIMLMLT